MSPGTDNERVRDLGEEALVERITGGLPFNAGVIAGAGDDCAIVESGREGQWLLLKTDCLIEGVHFVPGTDPVLVGQKAFNRVISDIAAMGGTPGHALVTVATDPDRSVSEIDGWYEGMKRVAGEVGCSIAGGETSLFPQEGALLSIAMTGTVAPDLCVKRSGAGVGDAILVTGQLGGSFESGRHLSFTPRLKESAWLCQYHKPTAMMDLSDGLGSDLPRLMKASGTGYAVDVALLPLHSGVTLEQAVSDGEDYELLMTVPADRVEPLLSGWRQTWPTLKLTKIGEVVEETRAPLAKGWEHYAER